MLVKDWFMNELNLLGKTVVVLCLGFVMVVAADAVTHKPPVPRVSSVQTSETSEVSPAIQEHIRKSKLESVLCTMESPQLRLECRKFIVKGEEQKLIPYLEMAFDHCVNTLGFSRRLECQADVYPRK